MKKQTTRNFLLRIGTVATLLFLFVSNFLTAQIVPVGSGSYTTQLPPADAAGRNHPPNGVPRVSGAALAKPKATSDWWTGLLTFNDANLYNYPLSMRGSGNGLVVSFTFLGQGANDTRQPMGPEQPLLVGVSGLLGTFPTVSDYTDWTVTASWRQNGRAFDATIGLGMPFVYCTKGSSDVASVVVNMGTVSVQSEMLLITNSISGANFAVYAPVGSTWSQSGNTYTSTLSGKNYYSVAMLPAGANAQTTANTYKQYAYVFPANTAVSWNYNETTSTVHSTFTVTPDIKEGSGTTVLQGLLPHQWTRLGASSAQPGSLTYATVRGTMKILAANAFSLEHKFKGVLSAIPNSGKYSPGFNPAALNQKIDLVRNSTLDTWTDSYNEGLVMNRLVQVAKIADQMGNLEARDQMMNTVRVRLENWLHAKPGENAFLFYYNNPWNTLIGYPAGHGSDANINDHHFHYANFINTATAIATYQPGWINNWGPMVNMLIKDVANTDRTSTMFPFLRTFSPYAGHSWAAGLLNNEPHGNNQESSSEAMNFSASLIHWGSLTGDKELRDLGIFLYTSEQTAIEEYWYDMSNRNFPPNYAHMMAARVWGNGHDRNTFWTADIAAMYGINMFPMTGSHLYHGHNKTYAAALWTNMTQNTGVLSNTPNPNLWFENYWIYRAFTDPAHALTLYNNFPNYQPKFGNSDAHTYHWLHSFNGMGTVDATVTANHPIAVVFNKAGDKTYVAHNYGNTPITVNYSDGYAMQVPARTLKTSKDADVKAVLSASQMQVATNETVTLTAEVTGAGVTKVEFYEGTTLLGTSMAAPYTLTTPNLPARVHGFYAKVYVGTALELSNVVSVIVGAQLPYQGNILSIPAQPLEPGHYDYYEGGIGQGISYFDATPTNEAGNFRSPEYVDAGPVTGEGNIVGWISDGEWLEYTVNITQAGAYDLGIRYVSGDNAGGGPFRMQVDGNTVADNITVGFTGPGWNTWATKTVTGVILPQGQHIIRLAFDRGGFNIGKITFTYTGTGEPMLNVSSEQVSITEFANSKQTVNITSNVSWTASSNQGWLTVSPAGAFGNGTVTFTAQENPATEAREAHVTFSGNGVANRVVTVTQNPGGVPYMLVSPEIMNFLFSGNTPQNIEITSNAAWTATSDQPWLSLNPPNGSGLAVIAVTAGNNPGTGGRTATITISAEGLPDKTIAVTQNGAPISITLPIDFESDGTYVFSNFDGGTGTVVINPFSGAGNPSARVGRIIRNGGAQWAGSLLTLSQKINFAALPVLSMKVYSPRAGLPVLLKLEGDVAPVERLATTTLANNWETLNWNFTGTQSNVFNKLVMMFDFGTVGDGSANSTFHFDNILQLAQPVVINWTGNVSTAWETPGNWSTNTVPNANSVVHIPAGRPRYPVVNANASITSLTGAAGTSVTLLQGVILNVLQ
jgi:endoglucanase Acf2